MKEEKEVQMSVKSWTSVAHHQRVRIVHCPSETKICDLKLVCIVQKKILWLEVAMNEAVAGEVLQASD